MSSPAWTKRRLCYAGERQIPCRLPPRTVTAAPDGQTWIYTAEIDQVLAAVVRTIAAETLYTFQHAILPRCQIALSADEKD